jgi:hypothetical protein
MRQNLVVTEKNAIFAGVFETVTQNIVPVHINNPYQTTQTHSKV